MPGLSEVQRTLKRSRSSSPDSDSDQQPARKEKKTDDTKDPQVSTYLRLKRARDVSPEDEVRSEDERAPKRAKLESPPSELDSDSIEPEHVHPTKTITVGGVKVTNLKLVSIDEHGDEIPLALESQPSTVGLPTPDPTPLGLQKGQNPFDTLGNAGLEEKSQSQQDSPANFAYVGDMKLFGNLPAQVYFYEHISDDLHPYTEVVKVTDCEKLSLGKFFPGMKGSAWNSIRLNNLHLCLQESATAYSAQNGMYLETDIGLQGGLQPASDFLRDFFHQESSAIRFSAWLGSERCYDKVACPPSMVLRGSLDHIRVNVLDILEFHRIGVELQAQQVLDKGLGEMQWKFGYGFFGTLHLSVPATAVPLKLDYKLQELNKEWQLYLTLQNDKWTHVFGIQGLTLSDVSMHAHIDRSDLEESELSFEIEALFELRQAKMAITGKYSKDEYMLEAEIGDLTLHDVGEIFHELLGFELDIFNHDVLFHAMTLRVSSEGLLLAGGVAINGYASMTGELLLSRDGIAVSGDLGDVEFDQLHLRSASHDVFIASKMDDTCARASKVAITGDVTFFGVDVQVGVTTEKDAETGELNWMMYGDVAGDMSTSRLSPELKGSFLDISLQHVAFIASNHDAPLLTYPGQKYPIVKGVQFCGAIDGIHELEQLLRGSVKGMILRAAYQPSDTFDLSIILPAERTIAFTDTVYSGPLEIEIQASATDMHLLLKAILNVKRDKDVDEDPMQFALGLKARAMEASAYAQMLADWMDPCGLGEHVVIRKCTLEFGIVYTTFFTTGTPGTIGMAGELAVGSKKAGVAMELSQNPKEQLISAQITDLGVVDLVQFASMIANEKFPEPEDFFRLHNVELYLSTGTSIGVTEYPAGASMKGDMTLFGKRARFNCTVGSKVQLQASIEQFQLGPLSVRGLAGPEPIVDIELSAEKQQVLIDGAVQIWDSAAACHLEANMYPIPSFDFSLMLKLSDLFLLKLQAKLSGDFNIKDHESWSKADFEVYGCMEQHLIDHVVSQLEQQLQAAQNAAKHGFDELKQDMDAKETAFKAHCQTAIDELEVSRSEWLAEKASIDAGFESAHAVATRIRKDLQAKVDEAERSFKGLIAEKMAQLEGARADATAAIQSAEHDIDDAQRDSTNAINEAQGHLQQVRREFEQGFDGAERDLESAHHDVENAQRHVDDLDRDSDHIDRRIDDELWYNCPPLLSEKAELVAAQAAATASLQVVRGIFFAAEAIVHGTGLAAAEGAIRAAQLALEGIETFKRETLDAARDALETVRGAHDAIIQTAIDALHAVETAIDELHVFDGARSALEGAEGLTQGIIGGVQEAVDGLSKCDEFIAFDAAEAALRFAQNNTSELNLARHAVELAEGAVNLGLDLNQWALHHPGTIFSIIKVEFSGSVQSLIHASADTAPLRVSIQGTVLGESFDFEIVWKPHFDLLALIKELFVELSEMIERFAKDLVHV